MKVGIIQSSYIPWRGYFDFINSVDLFIFHDDLQYTKQDWRNRNKIRSGDQWQWLTVPVKHKSSDQKIEDVKIDYSRNWIGNHIGTIQQNYARSGYIETILLKFSEILEKRFDYLSDLNRALCLWIMNELDIETEIIQSRTLDPQGSKTRRLIDILKKVGATSYLSGPAAKDYIDQTLFEDAGIGLEYKSYDYAPYPQIHGEFMEGMSVLDLLLNKGAEAGQYIVSQSPDVKVI